MWLHVSYQGESVRWVDIRDMTTKDVEIGVKPQANKQTNKQTNKDYPSVNILYITNIETDVTLFMSYI